MLDTLPSPMWQGVAENSLQHYAEFKLKHMIEMSSAAPRRLKDIYENAQRYTEHATERVASYRAEFQQVTDRLNSLRNELVETTVEQQIASVEALLALPYAIGTRLTAAGGLVVVIRVTGISGRTSYDVGDFEINLQHDSDEESSILWVRPCKSRDGDIMSYRSLVGFNPCRRFYAISGALYGKMNDLNDSTYGSLVDYIAAVHDKLAESPEANAYGMFRRSHFMEAASAAEPLWSGHLPVEMLAGAMKRYCDSRQKDVRERIESDERRSKDLAQIVERRVRELRDAKQTERMARVDYETAVANAAASVTIDVMAIKDELEYILRLPGIMGVRFLDTGEPVFHYRASNIYEGKRYDMGDHEIRLIRPRTDPSLAVLNVHPTRGRTLYTHKDSEYDQFRSWFCFGGRATHLNRLFDLGDFRSMMHMVVNTMNNINEVDRGSVMYRYEEIPMNLVWHTGRKKRRQRPRRQPRNKAQRLGAAALQAVDA